MSDKINKIFDTNLVKNPFDISVDGVVFNGIGIPKSFTYSDIAEMTMMMLCETKGYHEHVLGKDGVKFWFGFNGLAYYNITDSDSVGDLAKLAENAGLEITTALTALLIDLEYPKGFDFMNRCLIINVGELQWDFSLAVIPKLFVECGYKELEKLLDNLSVDVAKESISLS